MPAGHTAIPHPAALARERVGEAQSRAQREKRSSPIFAHGDHILVDLETRNEPLAVSTKQLPRDGRAGQRQIPHAIRRTSIWSSLANGCVACHAFYA